MIVCFIGHRKIDEMVNNYLQLENTGKNVIIYGKNCRYKKIALIRYIISKILISPIFF